MNSKSSYQIIGLMSGTSLDGLDIACANFNFESDRWNFELLHGETIPYSNEFENRLRNIAHGTALELAMMHQEFGKFCATEVNKFKLEHSYNPMLIASHGQTIFHNPNLEYTTQIGCGATIAALTGISTVCDFRTFDVANGGQGAPLVPIADKFLFSEYEACLNLGGFANISYDLNGNRIAFDICAVNTVLNYLANKLNKSFDSEGLIAQSGIVNTDLLNTLNGLDYFKLLPPKSLGYEWVKEIILPLIASCNDEVENILATFTSHIAGSIASTINNHLKSGKVLVTGGGANNKYLIHLLEKECNAKIIVGDKSIIDFKEAISFAFLGLLRYLEIDNTLKSVTGAKTNSIGGCIYLAK